MKRVIFCMLISSTILCCKTPKSKFIFEKVLWTCDWSPDDKLIALGGNNNKLKLISADDLSMIKEIDKPNTITKIKWHPDGNLLAISRQSNKKLLEESFTIAGEFLKKDSEATRPDS